MRTVKPVLCWVATVVRPVRHRLKRQQTDEDANPENGQPMDPRVPGFSVGVRVWDSLYSRWHVIKDAWVSPRYTLPYLQTRFSIGQRVFLLSPQYSASEGPLWGTAVPQMSQAQTMAVQLRAPEDGPLPATAHLHDPYQWPVETVGRVWPADVAWSVSQYLARVEPQRFASGVAPVDTERTTRRASQKRRRMLKPPPGRYHELGLDGPFKNSGLKNLQYTLTLLVVAVDRWRRWEYADPKRRRTLAPPVDFAHETSENPPDFRPLRPAPGQNTPRLMDSWGPFTLTGTSADRREAFAELLLRMAMHATASAFVLVGPLLRGEVDAEMEAPLENLCAAAVERLLQRQVIPAWAPWIKKMFPWLRSINVFRQEKGTGLPGVHTAARWMLRRMLGSEVPAEQQLLQLIGQVARPEPATLSIGDFAATLRQGDRLNLVSQGIGDVEELRGVLQSIPVNVATYVPLPPVIATADMAPDRSAEAGSEWERSLALYRRF